MLREKINDKSLVLIANDSEEDSFFLERALRQSARFHVVGSVRNSGETIAYLCEKGPYADRQLWPFPSVLLMDFHSAADRHEVMAWLKQQPGLHLKGTDLSGSPLKQDTRKVKELGAEAFSPNTSQHAELLRLVACLEELLLAAVPLGK